MAFETSHHGACWCERMQLSVCVEMEAYGAAASKQFCCKAREEPGLKSCDHQHRVQLATLDRGGFEQLLFQDSTNIWKSVLAPNLLLSLASIC